MAIGALILLILYGGWLSSVVIGVTLIYVLMRLSTYPVYRRTSEELLVKNARASSLFTETLFAISTIRAQGLEEQRRKSWLNQIAGSVTTSFRLARFDMMFAVLSAFITASDNVLILWLGISQVMEHKMTVGAFIAFGAFRGMFSDRILSLTGMFLQLRMLSVHSDRIADIALSNPETKDEKRVVTTTLGQEPLSLETRNLAFSYFSGSKPVFSGLDISIIAGESVAITGPSGCGKSTLMRVLCGLSMATEGCVLANGIEIYESGIQNYRKEIACILQEDRLLAGSIKDNITGFCENPDEEWMICCARAAYIHNDITSLPMGYETLTGELGEGLSGGQRQRIFIARALYTKPRILFMDEATSHLDETNEKLINEAISSLNITRIIIAHRLTTIASADRVISMY
jgi:ATP-binding cassette subfamily B protein RaxB